ncbi:hypothetical protein VTN49DRAFT_2063 [Thermomyces lanuginosus]|uniref:uncharacterized protein n=1 Tax=Thermomyces lanuginosus TaxID=5541 RepID=UPI0037424346
MLSTPLLLLALGAAAVEGFKDTSPFVLFSTADLPSSSSQVRSADALLDDVLARVKTCPSDYYVLVSQPGVHASDYSDRKATPWLRGKAAGADKSILSNLTVTEVSGVLDSAAIRKALKDCGTQVTEVDASTGSYPLKYEPGPRIIDISFPVLPTGARRAQQLAENDAFLAGIVDRLSSDKYTVIYVTSPREDAERDNFVYQSEQNGFEESRHIELKRNLRDNSQEDGPKGSQSVFEKYQFLSSGIFMGLFTSLICLGILYVGLSALLSLEVPYAAYEKDTSPGAQKKQQ